jgi:hypothetical protein
MGYVTLRDAAGTSVVIHSVQPIVLDGSQLWEATCSISYKGGRRAHGSVIYSCSDDGLEISITSDSLDTVYAIPMLPDSVQDVICDALTAARTRACQELTSVSQGRAQA